jgi:prepilin-type N-terminal cleavage/methylation domain-containing protein
MDRSNQPSTFVNRRRAMTLIEVIAAVSMLAVLLGSSVQMMRALGMQQRAAARRAMALQTVQAVTEELTNLPWNALTPAVAENLSVPEVAQFYLPGAVITATVEDVSQPVESKRLSVEMRWNAPSGKPAAPLRLTTWVYPDAVTRTP